MLVANGTIWRHILKDGTLEQARKGLIQNEGRIYVGR
jgi:hypothetical protein